MLLLGFTQNQGETSDDFAALITIEGPIEDVNAGFLSRRIEKATGSEAQLLIIQLTTPGGALTSTRDMVETLLSSRIPTAVYVAPPGARAASAGTFITAAANFAAMSPGTNIGAASPVTSTGEDLPETLAKMINEDTRALIISGGGSLPKVIVGRRVFVVPIIQRTQTLSLEVMTLTPSTTNISIKEGGGR